MELRNRPVRAAPVTRNRRGLNPRPVRNGLPGLLPYVYGARRPAWAVRAVAASIAEHGEPYTSYVED